MSRKWSNKKRPVIPEGVNGQPAQMPAVVVIGSREVSEATAILRKYNEGKAHLQSKIIANEEFWKLNQWNYMHAGMDTFKPATAWLWSCIQSRHADIMDSYPTCNFLPRQEDDVAEAKKLSAIVPIILEQNKYEETYHNVALYGLKHGGFAQGIFWDGSKHNGLGDITIEEIDFLNLFWEPGITDLQESANVFYTKLMSNKDLEGRYPQCRGRLGGQNINVAKYLYDDKVDTTDKSVVVDWYYHKYVNGKKTLQYVKYVNDIVLYATENERTRPSQQMMDERTGMVYVKETGESMAERGLYDHAMYPFVAKPLYPVAGSICGLGLIEVGRDTQMSIDKLNKAIIDNAVSGATPRYFVRGSGGGINEEEFADNSKPFVHVEGGVNEDNVRPIETKPLDGNYAAILENKVEELKYITSNQDSNNGVAPSGVTAASAIAALQETAGKNARNTNKAFHRAYREVCYQVVELIRQFYDLPRTFRVYPDGVHQQFVQYDNMNLKGNMQNIAGENVGFRVPEFDIEVTSEKANPYKKMEMNELALSFYNSGFFNPQMATQAMSCLQMMDFDRKEEIVEMVQKNGTLQEMLIKYQQLALNLAQRVDPMLAEQIGTAILQQGGQPMPQAIGATEGTSTEGEHPYVERARTDARASTQAE